MDRAALSDAIIAELGQLFVGVLRRNAAKLVANNLDGLEQLLQVLGREVFGPVVEQAIALIGEAYSGEHPTCPKCHQAMRPIGYARPRSLQGLVGDYKFTRPYFFCDRCHEALAPLDQHLGIGSGALSPGLERVACWFGIDDSFEEAAQAIHETLRIELADETERRVTEAIGQVAEAEAQAAIALAQAGKDPLPPAAIQATSPTLLVEVDGTVVDEVDGQWHEAKSELAAPLGPQLHEDEQSGRTTMAMGKPATASASRAPNCSGIEPQYSANASLVWT